MDAPYDWNDLDKAIFALRRSTAGLPEVFRQLTRGNLCALMPYHEEVVGAQFKIENGAPFQFIMAKDDEGEAVMLFSSEARAEEGMKVGRVPEKMYCVATMKAKEMLDVLGRMNMRAFVNRSCATGTFTMPADLMRDLVNGTALKADPIPRGQSAARTLNLIDPADYPTDLLQPLFETLRRDRCFRAAWVLRRPEPNAAGGTHYELMVLMDPRDEALAHDFNIVLQNSCKKPDEVSFGLIDENNHAYIESLLQQAAPFHRAPDFAAGRSSDLI